MKKFILTPLFIITLMLTSCGHKEVLDNNTVNQESKEEYYGYVESETLSFYKQIKELFQEHENVSLGSPNVSADTFSYHYSEDTVLHKGGKAVVTLNNSIGFPYVEICSDIHINPFQGFNLLIDNGFIKQDENATENFLVDGTEFNFALDVVTKLELNSLHYSQPQKEYAYSKEGCEEFMKAVITLAKTNIGNLNTLTAGDVYPNIYFSQEDDCYYSFVLNYNTSYAYITAIYLRSENNTSITNVTLQNLYIAYPTTDYAAGVSIGFNFNKATSQFEVITLMTAIEQTLTGDCYFSDRTDIPNDHFEEKYVIPFEYQVGNYKAELNRKNYDSIYEESFETHTYSIHLDR